MMCLDSVAKGAKAKKIAAKFQRVWKNIYVAYKLVIRTSHGDFIPVVYDAHLRRGKWYEGSTFMVDRHWYRAGFHALASPEVVLEWAGSPLRAHRHIVKVYLAGEFTFGTQHGFPCIVASRQKIVKVVGSVRLSNEAI